MCRSGSARRRGASSPLCAASASARSTCTRVGSATMWAPRLRNSPATSRLEARRSSASTWVCSAAVRGRRTGGSSRISPVIRFGSGTWRELRPWHSTVSCGHGAAAIYLGASTIARSSRGADRTPESPSLRLGPDPAVAVRVEQLAPARRQDVADARLTVHRIPVAVVVEPRGRVAPGHDRRAQQQVLERLERAPVDELLAPRGEGVLVQRAAEPEVHVL